MDVTVERVEKAHIVRVAGEVDMRTAPVLRKSLQELVESRAPFIIVNLSGISYIDSAGIATLVECMQQVRKYKSVFKLTEPRAETLEILELAKLDEVFDICSSDEEALA